MSCLWLETEPQARAAATMSPEEVGVLVCNVNQALNDAIKRGQVVPFVEKLFAPDVILHFAGDPKAYTRSDFIELLNTFHAAFPDWRSDIGDVIIEGDRAAVFETIRYTHTGEFVGLPPTGNQVAYQQMSFWRVADNLVQEIWTVADSRTVWSALMQPNP